MQTPKTVILALLQLHAWTEHIDSLLFIGSVVSQLAFLPGFGTFCGVNLDTSTFDSTNGVHVKTSIRASFRSSLNSYYFYLLSGIEGKSCEWLMVG